MILRTIICCGCGAEETEKTAGAGWTGWGHVNGISLNGEAAPTFCPACMAKIGTALDSMFTPKEETK